MLLSQNLLEFCILFYILIESVHVDFQPFDRPAGSWTSLHDQNIMISTERAFDFVKHNFIWCYFLKLCNKSDADRFCDFVVWFPFINKPV